MVLRSVSALGSLVLLLEDSHLKGFHSCRDQNFVNNKKNKQKKPKLLQPSYLTA